MKLESKNIVNKYSISKNKIEIIVAIVEGYVRKIGKEQIKGSNELIALLGVISEIYPILDDQEKEMKRGEQIIKKLLFDVTIGELSMISLHEGISNVGVFVSSLYKQTGRLKKELDLINKILCKIIYVKYKQLTNLGLVRTSEFDVIYGAAGIGNYLLQFTNDLEVYSSLQILCEYLISIVRKNNRKTNMPGWYIDLKTEPLYEPYASYGEGYINYTISHGCGGILLFLVNAYRKGVIVNGQTEAIEDIVLEYLRLNKSSNGVWWSGILSKEEYKKGVFPPRGERQSWCSGNISVLYAIYKASQLLLWKDTERDIFQRIKQIILMPTEQYGLCSPIICHGYAGLLTIFRNLYDETADIDIYKRMCFFLDVVVSCFDLQNKYGFKNKKFSNSKINISEDDNTFLNGAAGIIMELLSWLKEESYFERLLLIKS